MTSLLVLKEYIKKFYGKNEVYLTPLLKLLLAMTSLLMINSSIGYMKKIDNIAIVMIVALLCSFLPTGFIIVFASLFILLHFYALSLEIAVVALALFLVMYLLYFSFSPKDTIVVLLTPMLFVLKIPYVMPIAMGLLGTPASAVSVGCGVIVYYLLSYVGNSAASLGTVTVEEATAKFRMIIDGMLANKEMLVTVAAFAITVILVYLIRRLSIDHSWTIAMIAGAMGNFVILLLGDLLYDTKAPIVGIIIGSIVSVVLTQILQFFAFNLDYSRSEKVQFEDDEYYYYVKAVPKISVSTPTKTVKKINTQRHSAPQPTRSRYSESDAQDLE